MNHRRALCVDGPLTGATVSFPADDDTAVLQEPDGGLVTYRLGELLSTFPGSLYAASVVVTEP